MSFNFKEYLTLAQYLQLNLDSEAAIRTAISRAYYSTFSIAKIFCLNEKIINTQESKGPDSHSKVIKGLIAHEERDIQKIGKKIETLRIKRNSADYDSYAPQMNKAELMAVIAMTKDVHKSIEELNN